MSCSALLYGDQMMCGRCALQWDVGDPDRPRCLPELVHLDVAAAGPSLAAHSQVLGSAHRPRRWAVLLDRLPFRAPPGYHGPRQPGEIAPRLLVDGVGVGPLCRPFPDTARGRMECWEYVARMNIRRR